MKNALLTILFCLLASTTFAAGVIGPANPVGKPGQFSMGPGLFYYSGEWDNDVKAEQFMAYLQAGYTMSERCEIYAQLGAADLKVKDLFDNTDFEDGYRPFGSIGIRGLIADRKPIAMGVFLQGSYFDDYEDTNSLGGTQTRITFEKDYEVLGGITLQTVMEGATLYAGPFLYIREGDTEVATAAGTASGSFEDQSNLGGFLGIRWPLANGFNIELEGQIRSKVSAGALVQYNF